MRVYAAARPTERGLELKLHEHNGRKFKKLHVVAENASAARKQLPAIEQFLMVNYKDFSAIPAELMYEQGAIKEGAKVLASDLDQSRLVFHKLRSRARIYAKAQPTEQGLKIELSEHNSEEVKSLVVNAENTEAAFSAARHRAVLDGHLHGLLGAAERAGVRGGHPPGWCRAAPQRPEQQESTARPPQPPQSDRHLCDAEAHRGGAGGPAQRAQGRGAQGVPHRQRERHGRVQHAAHDRAVPDSQLQEHLGAAERAGVTLVRERVDDQAHDKEIISDGNRTLVERESSEGSHGPMCTARLPPASCREGQSRIRRASTCVDPPRHSSSQLPNDTAPLSQRAPERTAADPTNISQPLGQGGFFATAPQTSANPADMGAG